MCQNNVVIKHFEIPKTSKEIEIDVSVTILSFSNGDLFCLTMYLPYKAGFIVYTSDDNRFHCPVLF